MSDHNRLVGHKDHQGFEAWLFGQNTDGSEVLVNIKAPGTYPLVKKNQMIWYPTTKLIWLDVPQGKTRGR